MQNTEQSEQPGKDNPDILDGGASEAVIDRLSAHIHSVVEEFKKSKSAISEELNNCRRQSRSEYSDTEKSNYSKAGVGCVDYYPMTENKINVAHALLFDVIHQAGERTWMIEPTPEPDLPESVSTEIVNKSVKFLQQWQDEGLNIVVEDAYQLAKDMRQEMRNLLDKEATQCAERMQNKMDDQLVEGKFWEAIEATAKDFCTYPAAFFRAVERMDRVARFVNGKYEEKDTVLLQWERVSPFNVYPSRNNKKLDDDSLFQKVSYSRAELVALGSTTGYDEGKINKALGHYGESGLVEKDGGNQGNVETSRYNPGDKEYTGYISAGVVEGYEYWGNVPGVMLKEWGMKDDMKDNDEYAIHAILIGEYIIFAQLNPNPLQKKLFYCASYEEDADSIWGGSLPRKIRSPQTGMNSTRRSLFNNMAISSGPQAIVDKSLLDPSCDPTQIYPFKIWYTDSSQNAYGGSTNKPVEFFQPDANLRQIIPVMDRFLKESDELSGLPRYTQGDADGARIGAAKTATGLSMLMNAQAKTFKNIVSNFDRGFIKKALEDLYYRNLADPEIEDDAKGDMKIITKGILGMSLHEQLQLRRQEFLKMVLSSEVLMGIIKQDGLVKLLREVVKTLDMSAESLLPNDSKLEAMEEQLEKNKMLQGVSELLKASVSNKTISPEQYQMIISMMSSGGQGIIPKKPESAPVEQGGQDV